MNTAKCYLVITRFYLTMLVEVLKVTVDLILKMIIRSFVIFIQISYIPLLFKLFDQTNTSKGFDVFWNAEGVGCCYSLQLLNSDFCHTLFSFNTDSDQIFVEIVS